MGMESVIIKSSEPVALALFHSIWQGLLVYLILRLFLRVSSKTISVNLRYWVSVVALTSIPIILFATILNQDGSASFMLNKSLENGLAPASFSSTNAASIIDSWKRTFSSFVDLHSGLGEQIKLS